MQIERRAVCTECKEAAPRQRKGKKFKLCEDCRRADTTRRWKVRKALRQLRNEVTHVVEYNQGEGWRVGYLVKIIDRYADVQPIGSCGRVPDLICVSLADIKLPSCGSPSMPTVEDFYKRMEAMKPKKTVLLVAETPRKAAITAAIRAAAPVLSAMSDLEDLAHDMEPIVVDEKNELAGPEVGDVSFPYGANVQETATFTQREQPKKVNSGVIQPSVSIATCKALAEKSPNGDTPKSKRTVTPIIAGTTYGLWTTVEYTGHSRWKCVSDSGEEKVLYSAELRTAAAAK